MTKIRPTRKNGTPNQKAKRRTLCCKTNNRGNNYRKKGCCRKYLRSVQSSIKTLKNKSNNLSIKQYKCLSKKNDSMRTTSSARPQIKQKRPNKKCLEKVNLADKLRDNSDEGSGYPLVDSDSDSDRDEDTVKQQRKEMKDHLEEGWKGAVNRNRNP